MSEPERVTNPLVKKFFLFVIATPIVLWAFAFPFIKIGLEELDPVNLTIMRLFIGCAIFLVFILMAPERFSKLHREDLLTLFFLGFFGLVVYNLGLNYGEQYVSPSVASLIIATIPVFTVIFSMVFLKETLTRKIAVGAPLSLIGVVIISVTGTKGNPFEITYISAAAAVLVAALVGVFYTIMGKKLLQRYNALSLTVYAYLFGSLGLLPFLSSSLVTEVSGMTWTGWGAVLFLAGFPTVIGYVLWYVALEVKTASEVSVFLYFIPILSTVISYLLFHDVITILFVAGAALVILGLVIVNKKESKKNLSSG